MGHSTGGSLHTNLTGSEHMICEFQIQHTLDYTSKSTAVLKEVVDYRDTEIWIPTGKELGTGVDGVGVGHVGLGQSRN